MERTTSLGPWRSQRWTSVVRGFARKLATRDQVNLKMLLLGTILLSVVTCTTALLQHVAMTGSGLRHAAIGRRTRPVMMGSRVPSDADMPTLERGIREYLKVRERQLAEGSAPPEFSNKFQPGGAVWNVGETFMSLNSLLPKEREESEYEKLELDPLSYEELIRFGRDDLIDPIINLGGYEAVSRKLDVPIFPKRIKASVLQARAERAELFKAKPEPEGMLALGDSFEDKLAESVAKLNTTQIKTRVNLRQKARRSDGDAPSKVFPNFLRLRTQVPPLLITHTHSTAVVTGRRT